MDPTDSHEMYVGALADSKYDSAELEEVHTLRDKMVATLDPRYLPPSFLAIILFCPFPCNYLSSRPFLLPLFPLPLSPLLPSLSPPPLSSLPLTPPSPSLLPRSPRVRAILRDVKQLQESLPIHPDSSVFVRQVRYIIGHTH